jgi:hypothetical protein
VAQIKLCQVFIQNYHENTDPAHLSLYVQRDLEEDTGIVFDIRRTGEKSAHTYTFQALDNICMKKSKKASAGGRALVGYALDSGLELHDIQACVEQVEVKSGDPHWNCRNWARAAYEKIRDEGHLSLHDVKSTRLTADGQAMDEFPSWDAIEQRILEETKDVVRHKPLLCQQSCDLDAK